MIYKALRKFFFYFIKLKMRLKNVYFNKGGYFERTDFEGSNKVGYKSKLINSKVGFGSYIGAYNDFNNVLIGRYCSIANDISLDIGSHPTSKFVSTNPLFYSKSNPSVNRFAIKRIDRDLFIENKKTDSGYNIEIGNDVWVCNGVRIKQGVKIGDGAIVASGSVVIKDVEAYTIVAGVPAKKIRSRFTDDEIDLLLKLKWWNKDIKWINEHFDYFQDIKLFVEKLKNDATNK